MKEQIAEIIKYHSASQLSLMKHEDMEKVMKDIEDLAEKIDKAIGIDREKVEEILVSSELYRMSNYVGKTKGDFSQDGLSGKDRLLEAINQSCPLKCEVES